MFFIFGWGNRYTKDFGSTLIQTCSICSQENYFHLVRVGDWFDLFFIPIFPYNTEYHLMCPNCEGALKLEDNDMVETLKEMAEVVAKFDEKDSIILEAIIKDLKYSFLLKTTCMSNPIL